MTQQALVWQNCIRVLEAFCHSCSVYLHLQYFINDVARDVLVSVLRPHSCSGSWSASWSAESQSRSATSPSLLLFTCFNCFVCVWQDLCIAVFVVPLPTMPVITALQLVLWKQLDTTLSAIVTYCHLSHQNVAWFTSMHHGALSAPKVSKIKSLPLWHLTIVLYKIEA